MKVTDPPGGQMQVFAESFLSTLDESQTQVASLPYESAKRIQWHFIPKKERKGLVLSEMNDAQRTAALRLLRSALSEAGYDKVNRIMMLENVLAVLEGDQGNWARDPNKYYITVFGKPSSETPWGLSFEGHHLSLNFVCRDGKMVDSTPQFLATNPAQIMNEVVAAEGFKLPPGTRLLGKGTRVLRDEEEFGFELVRSLSEEQLKTALIAEEAPPEIRFAGESQPSVAGPEGIPYSDLNAQQQQTLENLVEVYLRVVAPSVADQRRKLIEKNGWKNVHFAWAGATKAGIGHYYRVRGKDFLIEFVNTQPDAVGNPANHVHAVFRDLSGDFDLAP